MSRNSNMVCNEADGGKVEIAAACEIAALTPPIELPRISHSKKLLVLDLNGLLAHTFFTFENVKIQSYLLRPDGIFGNKLVFKRPFCDEFLQFCFSKFEVGIWSTAKKGNVDPAVNFLVGRCKDKLLFTWSNCKDTGFKTLENKNKPLLLKELKTLWENQNGTLPWEKGRFSSSNTLLIDDSPYKALKNPPNTAIFPYPYRVEHVDDTSLGPNGDLRVYLEGLVMADNVPSFVEAHPFGQPVITASHPDWNFYSKIVNGQ